MKYYRVIQELLAGNAVRRSPADLKPGDLIAVGDALLTYRFAIVKESVRVIDTHAVWHVTVFSASQGRETLIYEHAVSDEKQVIVFP